MEISSKYDPTEIEDKWYAHWMDHNYFHSEPDDREPFTIVIPPPNVTGILHMGHVLNNTIQDILVRKARLEGKNTCWVPGTDHASIATEAKVVAKLREEGIDKHNLSREKFLEHAWEWREKHGGIILEQLKKLGASCDWERTAFTMDDTRSRAVIKVFVDLHKKGYIYRGERMVNWDPVAKTAVSDEEVNHKEVNSTLYHVRYAIKDSSDFITIATTRPETILGDTAICVHPKDDRYKHLVGGYAMVPLIGRAIPIIADAYVDREFGTGALKITPAHDPNDWELGKKHKLETIDILTADGKLSEKAQLFVGEDRFKARKSMARALEEKGFLVKTEGLKNKVGYSERTDAVIEPRISMQWFVKMDELVKPAIEHVMNDDIRFFPDKFKNVYRHWMENIHNWCISRQLWWGQRIPAWYYGEGEFVVAENAESALAYAREISGKDLQAGDLHQDEDVVDTWFSSWLWPISVFNGFEEPENEDINYYYPTNDLVTAPEIIFFWVARMIIAGYEYRGEKPFKNVYFTGIVRDAQRRKMSKSLGNSPDPLDLIAEFGADAMRTGMLFSSPAGNDLLFDRKLIEQGRNFNNKIWNAMRLVKGWQVTETDSNENEPAIAWFDAKLAQIIMEMEDHFTRFSLSEALKELYTFVWDDFCSWYLEMIKPGKDGHIDQITYDKTIGFFEDCLRLLHPFMPFITEEIWHHLKDRKPGEDLVVDRWPTAQATRTQALKEGEMVKSIVARVRDIRNQKQISPKEPVTLLADADALHRLNPFAPVLHKLANLDGFRQSNGSTQNAIPFVVNKQEFFVLADIEVDEKAERERLEKEVDYLEGFIKSVQKKLQNERFVNNAPKEVVDKERLKLADGEAKLAFLKAELGKVSQ